MKKTIYLTFALLMIMQAGALGRNKCGLCSSNNDNETLEWIRPRFLQPGDSVGIMSISSPLEEDEAEAAKYIAIVESWGLKVKLGENIFSHSYQAFSAPDSLRAAEFERMMLNDNLKAVIMYRGGSGSARTVRYLDLSLLRSHPKWLLGFSDVTTYLNLCSNLHVESIHAAMLNSFVLPKRMKEDEAIRAIYPDGVDSTALSSRDALFGCLKPYHSAPHKYNRHGKAEGRIVGGNMSIMSISYGTPYELNVEDDSILFIEEVGENMNTCDRYMTQLKNSGKLDKVRGIIIGRFRNIKDGENEWGGMDIYDLIDSYTGKLGIPVLYWMKSGHGRPNFALYMGRKVSLTVDENGGSIEFK